MFGNRCRAAHGEGGLNIGDMADEWIERWALLGGKNAGDGIRITGIRADPIYRFRWKGDEATVMKRLCRHFQADPGYREAFSPSLPLRLLHRAAALSVTISWGLPQLANGHHRIPVLAFA